jgi:alcohol dehydrogenase class IV
MSYPVAGMVREYRPQDYDVDYPLVPHGIAVILNAPAVFRWTAAADPQRHLYAAQLLGADIRNAQPEDAGDILADAIIGIMKQTSMPNGLGVIGFTEQDAEALAEGTLAQQRLTKLSPRQVNRDELIALFSDAMRYW